MKSTMDLLTEKDRMALADLYESENYKSLKKLLDLERLELAKSCLVLPQDRLENVQGRAIALKDLNLALKNNFKIIQNKEFKK